MKITRINKFLKPERAEISFKEYLDIILSPTRWDEEDNSPERFRKLKQSFINLSELLIEKGIIDIEEFRNRVIENDKGPFLSFEFEA